MEPFMELSRREGVRFVVWEDNQGRQRGPSEFADALEAEACGAAVPYGSLIGAAFIPNEIGLVSWS
jgi:hypothetical protein